MGRRSLRVLHLTHPDFLPPDDASGYSEAEINVFKTDFDVVRALRDRGHEVRSLGVLDELKPIREAIEDFAPHVVFNLLEEFAGLPEFDQHVVAFLELHRVPYTGCNPRGMTLSRGKALSKKIAAYHRIRAPRFAVFKMGRKARRPPSLDFPMIVKSLIDEASLGISQASVVHSEEKLAERVAFIHGQLRTDAIVEQFVDGRELYVGVLGNERLTTFPVWELHFGRTVAPEQRIATERVKHDVRYQKKRRIHHGRARNLPEALERELARTSKRIFRALSLDGYARIDYRLAEDGRFYFLEANPNPEVAWEEEFASAAEAAGLAYPDLIQRIVNLGLSRRYRF